jgi:2-phosphosulfolactate phosphatase
MRLRVDLLPSPPYKGTVIFIDLLRFCTVAPILFENGLDRLAMTSSVKLARINSNGDLLIGEREGFPPGGFNYGSSPAELSRIDLQNRRAILVSDNAPWALASLYNATAVAEAVIDLGNDSIAIVCCGFKGRGGLDDALTEGFLAGRLKPLVPKVRLEGAGSVCVSLRKAFPSPLEGLLLVTISYAITEMTASRSQALLTKVTEAPH